MVGVCTYVHIPIFFICPVWSKGNLYRAYLQGKYAPLWALLAQHFYKGDDIMKYDIVYQFAKKGNLLDYFNQKSDKMHFATAEQYDRWQEYYAQEREINLYAMVRYKIVPDEQTQVICKIKCPVSPIPAKGEFELPGEHALFKCMQDNGWQFKQKIPLHMFD